MSNNIYYFGENYNFVPNLPTELCAKISNELMPVYPSSNRLMTFNSAWVEKTLFFTKEKLELYLNNSSFSDLKKNRMLGLTPGHGFQIMKTSTIGRYYCVCLNSDLPLFKDIVDFNDLRNEISEINKQIVKQTESLQEQLRSLNSKKTKLLKNKPYIKYYT
jgi:hypothetical protein